MFLLLAPVVVQLVPIFMQMAQVAIFLQVVQVVAHLEVAPLEVLPVVVLIPVAATLHILLPTVLPYSMRSRGTQWPTLLECVEGVLLVG